MPDDVAKSSAVTVNPFVAADVAGILRERGWLAAAPSTEQLGWCERAAALLGGHVADRGGLADLLNLVFHYDPREILAKVETHAVLSRYAARDVLRQLGLLLLEGIPLTSERFKEIVTALKEGLDIRGRELFHPICAA